MAPAILWQHQKFLLDLILLLLFLLSCVLLPQVGLLLCAIPQGLYVQDRPHVMVLLKYIPGLLRDPMFSLNITAA